MKINIVSNKLEIKELDTLIVFCYEGGENLGDIQYFFPDVLEKQKFIINNNEFVGKKEEVVSINFAKCENLRKIIFAGVGSREEVDAETIRRVFSKAIKEAINLKSKIVGISFLNIKYEFPLEVHINSVIDSAILASYSFRKYKSKHCSQNTIHSLQLIVDQELSNKAKKWCKESMIVAESTILARDLVNEPANYLTPIKLAEKASCLAQSSPMFSIKIFEQDEIKKLEMNAFLEVAKASNNSPRLIVMRYYGNSEDNQVIGLIGKGITYDSGGLSLKGKQRLITMKHDMAGAAAVIGVMSAVSRMSLKVNVVGIIAACENMLSANGYKPGDIIKSMAGKTILINSTDAEGRLTLVDAIHYGIEKEGINKIIDIASLTGGARLTFGDVVTAVFTNDDGFMNNLLLASKISGEKFWRLPLFDDYRSKINCDIADLVNSSEDESAKAIVGGMFIKEFAQNKPWLHLDIAGTCWSNKDIYYLSKGGTGVGVKSLYYLLKSLQ